MPSPEANQRTYTRSTLLSDVNGRNPGLPRPPETPPNATPRKKNVGELFKQVKVNVGRIFTYEPARDYGVNLDNYE